MYQDVIRPFNVMIQTLIFSYNSLYDTIEFKFPINEEVLNGWTQTKI